MSEVTPGSGGVRAVGGHSTPMHCPYCADEDLFPHGESHGAWECRGCRRAFTVKFLGLLAPGSAGSTVSSGATGSTEVPR